MMAAVHMVVNGEDCKMIRTEGASLSAESREQAKVNAADELSSLF